MYLQIDRWDVMNLRDDEVLRSASECQAYTLLRVTPCTQPYFCHTKDGTLILNKALGKVDTARVTAPQQCI